MSRDATGSDPESSFAGAQSDSPRSQCMLHIEKIVAALHSQSLRERFCRLLNKLVPKAVMYSGRREGGGTIRVFQEKALLPCLSNYITSHTASSLVLPISFYVQIAHAYQKIQAEKSKGSGTLVRKKQ